VPGTWYGWQILVTDLGALGLIAGGIALTSNSTSFVFIPVIGGVTYLADAPTIYGLHGDTSRIPGSLLRRILLPAAGAGVGVGLGALVDSGSGRTDCSEGCAAIALGVVGFGIGVLSAMIVDWVSASEPDRAAPPVAATGETWAPVVVVGSRSQSVGLLMRF